MKASKKNIDKVALNFRSLGGPERISHSAELPEKGGLSTSNVSNRTWHMRRMRNFRIIMRCPKLLNTLAAAHTHTAINLSGRH